MQLLLFILLSWVGVILGHTDLNALLEFKNGIKEDPLGRLTGSWNANKVAESSGCPLDWYGVQCSDGRVVSIMLNDSGLAGNFNFSNLVDVEMLRNLSVANNQLTGILTPDIGSLKYLEFLDLSGNLFTGSIPRGFGSLEKLKYLDLRSNRFSGRIDFLAEMQNVVHVDLSCNSFSGPITLLSGNSSIVRSIQYLNVSNNGLSADLFAQDATITMFDNLEVFDASNNKLTGQVPTFQFAVSLQILRLRCNQFSGSFPEALLKESSMVLSELDLSCNHLQGPIGSITSTTLKNLNLSSNTLSGSLPPKVGSCSIVDLSNNVLSGNFSTIQRWGNYVQVIDVSSNSLTGTLPDNNSTLLRLSSLYVSNNSLRGELPLVLGTYPELSVIDFSKNQLYGSLPPNLFTSFRLTYLNLSRNNFSGSIPISSSKRANSSSTILPLFTQNSSLLSLDLSGNSLSGSLPQGLISLNALKILKVSENNFSGQIPKEIGMLQNLEDIDLSNNHFEGSIPENLPSGLIGFNVTYNDLSGVIPDNLVKFPNSSFHPGNTLLVFPQGSSNSPSHDRENHVHAMKPLIRNLVIGGLAGTASVMILLIIMMFIYCKASTPTIKKKDSGDKGASPPNHSVGLEKNADIPLASSSFPETSMPLGGPPLNHEHGDITFGNSQSAETRKTQSPMTNEVLDDINATSPGDDGKARIALFSSSPISRDPHSSEQPPVLRVGSPDKLAGDLHLFDNSFLFTAEELSRAPAEIIGRSCHGTSYKATLDSEHVVTVKWLREGISKGKKEFAREAKKLGNIRHPNLVSLKGFYWGPREHERLIISGHVNSVSLTAHLCEFEQRKLKPLSMAQRLRIAVDIACCLHFLHNERAIPHGNLKSSNVVLQLPGLNVLLTDYSLHRIMTTAGMAEQVLNAGALGYRPPEFASTSKPCPSLKSDVYAFGVILLELLTGKNAGEIVSNNPGIVDLTDWVRLLANERRSFECFDRVIPQVDSPDGPPKLLEDMLLVALRCIRSASERPEIRTIFEDLSSLNT